MFRLEKVFQNDDSGFIFFVIFIKSVLLFLTIYSFSILNKNSIYDILNLKIYTNSNFFIYSIFVPIFYFLLSFFLTNRLEYKQNFISFLKEDIINFSISNILSFSIFFIFKKHFKNFL